MQKLGTEVAQTILDFHSLTGTDATSFLSGRGRGKGEAWKHLVKNIQIFSQIKHLGDTWEVSDEACRAANSFICSLYDKDNLVGCKDLNLLRYKLFGQPGKEKMLPATQDSFDQHLLRCNYQCCKWKLSLDFSAHIRSPVGHGWEIDSSGNLKVVLSTQPAAPISAVEFTRCGCRTGCVSKKYSCSSNNLQCTNACKCEGEDMCQNPLKEVCYLSSDSEETIYDDDSDCE